jgi:hypothetical protein
VVQLSRATVSKLLAVSVVVRAGFGHPESGNRKRSTVSGGVLVSSTLQWVAVSSSFRLASATQFLQAVLFLRKECGVLSHTTRHFLDSEYIFREFPGVASSARFDSTFAPWFQLVKATYVNITACATPVPLCWCALVCCAGACTGVCTVLCAVICRPLTAQQRCLQSCLYPVFVLSIRVCGMTWLQ